MYEHYGKKNNLKYQEGLKQLPEIDFERYNGGYRIAIQNYAKPAEHKFCIKSTSGEVFATDDAEEFIKKIRQVINLPDA